jgi:hypothetical protein
MKRLGFLVLQSTENDEEMNIGSRESFPFSLRKWKMKLLGKNSLLIVELEELGK